MLAVEEEVAEENRYGVYPYAFNKNLFPEDMLERIYNDLHDDDLYREVMHERELPKAEFIEFLDMYPHTILSILTECPGQGQKAHRHNEGFGHCAGDGVFI